MPQTKHETWFGYARVSKDDQNLKRQLDALEPVCAKVWQESESSLKTLSEREAVLGYVRAGDTLVVLELTRLGRRVVDVKAVVETLKQRKVKLSILNSGGEIDLNSAVGNLFLNMLAMVGEFEQDLLSERIRSGIAAARRDAPGGKYKRNRKPKLSADQVTIAQDLLKADHSMAWVAQQVGVSRTTLWRALRAA